MSIGSTDGVNQVTGFERAWNASDKHRFARIQRQCVVQNDISIRQLPRSDLHRLVLSSPTKRFRLINSTHFRREEQQLIMSKLSSISSGRRMANWLPWSLEKRHINKVYPPLECTIQSASAPTAPPKQTPIEMESVRLASCQKKKKRKRDYDNGSLETKEKRILWVESRIYSRLCAASRPPKIRSGGNLRWFPLQKQKENKITNLHCRPLSFIRWIRSNESHSWPILTWSFNFIRPITFLCWLASIPLPISYLLH